MAERLECDLVMRGGITSGIVYPRAIAKLAETYDFRSIGGTSAGAIAAAATAAAAYGAKTGENHFQTDIKGLPESLGTEIGGKTRLERLFQPGAETGRLFRVLMSGLGHENKVSTVAAIAKALCVNYWPYALVGAAIGLVPLLLLALTSVLGGAATWILFIVGLVPALVFILAATLLGALRDVITKLPKNGYGLCGGSSNSKPDEADVLPLTDWMHDYFQKLANLPPVEPVTFGHLWDPDGKTSEPDMETAEREIDLVLMTTNITRGISQRLPFLEGSWGQLFFNRTEFEALFPEAVVEHMWKKRAPVRHPEVDVPEGYYPLPSPADLPILLGARMSLSFPFLLGAVPLYAANVAKKGEDGKIPLQRCWFSDGGLTSNFPLHFFDSPLPSRPTFGINLVPASVKLTETEDEVQQISPGPQGAGEDAWSISTCRAAIRPASATRLASTTSRGRKAASRGSLVRCSIRRGTGDTELMAMPGYRDRIVHVELAKDEGGMNLNMKPELIKKIGERGEKASELLSARFAPNPGPDPQNGNPIVLTWDNHLWIRYRSLMSGIELLIKRMRKAWGSGYADLLDRDIDEAPGYKFRNGAQQDFARTATKCVLDAAEKWTGETTFDRYDGSTAGRSPRPKPVLRMMPPGSNDPRAERVD